MLLTEAPPLAVAEAQRRILARIRTLPPERVALSTALGRVLAEPISARGDIPPWDNSAMDGYAVRAAEVAPGVALPVALDLPAGAADGATLPPASAARIMTGAPLPNGADAVVPVERTEGPVGEGSFARVGERVRFTAGVEPGSHVRRRGEDVRAGATAVPLGAICGAAQLAMAAAAGHATVAVVRRPRVAIVSTGDELVDVDQAGAPGRIVNGNAYGLAAQVTIAGGEAWKLPIVPDDQDAIVAAVVEALSADAVITIGGVSVGERDHVRQALAQSGVELAFWRVAMRPGGPFAFGTTAEGRAVFALPGNPVSAHVTFELFARPALRRMAGHARCFRRPFRARLAETVEPHAEKALYLRGHLSEDAGGWRVATTGPQGSAVLSSLVAADCLIVVPPGTEPLVTGAGIDVLPLGESAFEAEEP